MYDSTYTQALDAAVEEAAKEAAKNGSVHSSANFKVNLSIGLQDRALIALPVATAKASLSTYVKQSPRG